MLCVYSHSLLSSMLHICFCMAHVFCVCPFKHCHFRRRCRCAAAVLPLPPLPPLPPEKR
jgi:hypothetical protein